MKATTSTGQTKIRSKVGKVIVEAIKTIGFSLQTSLRFIEKLIYANWNLQ